MTLNKQSNKGRLTLSLNFNYIQVFAKAAVAFEVLRTIQTPVAETFKYYSR